MADWGNLREKRATANVTAISWTLVLPTACYLLVKHGHQSNGAACLNSESSFSNQERQTTNNCSVYQMEKNKPTAQKHSIRVVLQMSGVKCFMVHKMQ